MQVQLLKKKISTASNFFLSYEKYLLFGTFLKFITLKTVIQFNTQKNSYHSQQLCRKGHFESHEYFMFILK